MGSSMSEKNSRNAASSKAKTGADVPARIDMMAIPGKSDGYCFARSEMDPDTRHAVMAFNATADLFSQRGHIAEHVTALRDITQAAAEGDLSLVTRTLGAQVFSLDTLFTQLAQRALSNMGKFPEAAERYMRMALKAQAQSRASIEALAKIHQPREQTVHHRHYHVDPDGKAVFVENRYGGLGNSRFAERPYEAGAAAFSGSGAALPRAHTPEDRVPVSGDAERAV